MYKSICKNINNHGVLFDFDESNPRYGPIAFLILITDLKQYELHKLNNTELYLHLSQFLFHISKCARCEQLLYELDMLNITGMDYNIDMDFDEPHRLLHTLY
jgi:hypothetical protein